MYLNPILVIQTNPSYHLDSHLFNFLVQNKVDSLSFIHTPIE